MSGRSRDVSIEQYEPALDNENDHGSSDYGPDFTSDEEELLNELLKKAGSVTDEADEVGARVTTANPASAPVAVGTRLSISNSEALQGEVKLSSISRLVDASNLDVDVDVDLDVDADFALLVADIEDQGDVVAALAGSRSRAALAQGLEEVRNNRPGEF